MKYVKVFGCGDAPSNCPVLHIVSLL